MEANSTNTLEAGNEDKDPLEAEQEAGDKTGDENHGLRLCLKDHRPATGQLGWRPATGSPAGEPERPEKKRSC